MTSLNGTMECTYRGVPYEARVKWDDETDLFHGEVSNMRDVITFQGRTVEELQAAFKASIQDYLNFCAETGDPPERPFSGRFLARVPPPCPSPHRQGCR